ncbi:MULTISPECIES: hypothetical protein [unclassified Haladaptatus]|uniref:hypothetical protein n=1 Tax=unclassified Haladaptatus TaxID=2622732 RepID=UPI00209C376F|nr:MULTISPECIES: hypothetical protein [unclassified Haladaptatus]MCO8246553.1 hypothetical protein [Haladaptatus sp. AB643]MCO8254791.1 hypothetical protein [Haladaptatus sp. AB618]
MRDSDRWWRRIDISRLLPTSIRRRHARKFFVGVLFVMLVTSSVGAFSYAKTKDRMDSQVRDQLSSTAELQADGLNGWVAGLRRQTRTLSKAKQFQNGNVEQIDSFMLSEHGSMDDTITAVHYIDVRSGNVLSSTSSNVTGKTMTSLGSSWNRTTVENHASVSSYVDETNEKVQEIHDTTEKQAESTGEVVEKVNDVATISEVTSAEAQTVAAAAEEQTGALSAVEESVADLERRAKNLRETMETFETAETLHENSDTADDPRTPAEHDDSTVETKRRNDRPNRFITPVLRDGSR